MRHGGPTSPVPPPPPPSWRGCGACRGKWRSIGKTTVSQQGSYALAYVVRLPGRDKVKVRALVDGTATTLPATSPVKRITILR